MKHDVKSINPLKDLNLTDRFLFDMVMEDLQTQQDVLSIIFGRDIPLLSQGETEKEFRVSPSVRSIRMDAMFILSAQRVRKSPAAYCRMGPREFFLIPEEKMTARPHRN